MVRATFAGFSTALSALQANQKRLDISGQNLANMNTVGYTRQTLQTSSLNYTHPVSHYMNGSEVVVGFGVHMDKVTQLRDPYLDAQYRSQMQKAGYTDGLQSSLDRLADIFDESQINGIHSAFANIQSTLLNMQDPGKVNDAIFESELRTRMQSLTNLLNDASRQIDAAEEAEYTKLDGKNVNDQGAVQEINNILQQIGSLNRQIKKNQIAGQQSLELMDERNVLLDTLSSYIPIEVTYYKDAAHDGKAPVLGADGNPVLDANGKPKETAADYEIYDYDGRGNVIGKKEWPDDVRVELVYQESDGAIKKFTLVDGSEGKTGEKNYAQISMPKHDTIYNKDGTINPDAVALTFTAPDTVTTGENPLTFSKDIDNDKGKLKKFFGSGSVQASLDMLWKDGDTKGINDVRGYEFYRGQLDDLAKAFAHVMNTLNIKGNKDDANAFILADRITGSGDAKDITAKNIGLSQGWVSGDVHIGTVSTVVGKEGKHGDENDTVLNMLEAMTASYPYSNLTDTVTGEPLFGKLANGSDSNPYTSKLNNNSFSNYMNYTSTILANDSYRNTNDLKTNVTVLNGIQSSRDDISGVSLDEEASNLMMYMSAYNAASRLMTTMDEALNTILNMGLVGR